jgi:serine/threonine protein kinase
MNETETGGKHILIDNKYALLNQIGEGGFGGIFLARDLEKNFYAVKLNRMEKSDQIEREIQLMSYFDHPNVLSIEDHSIKKGLLKNETGETVCDTLSYLVMPFASMGDLGSYLTGSAYFEEDVAVYLFHQINYGLNHIHDKGYVHLDMKPDNILINND